MLIAVLSAVAGLAGPVAALAGIVGGGGGTWLASRAVWRRLARRTGDHIESLGATLIAAARRAAAEGRVMRG